MVLAKELVDKLKKIEDFDITYESSDKDSGEIYILTTITQFLSQNIIYTRASSAFLEDYIL